METLNRCRCAFVRQRHDPRDLVPEHGTFIRASGRYVTLVGSNPLFHLPQDRWLDAVDPDAVARVAAAVSRLVLELTR